MLKEGIELLVSIGLLDVVLPFVLVFSILYGLLQRVKPFGKDNARIHSVISLITGLVFVGVGNYVGMVQSFVIYFALFCIVIVFIAILSALLGVKDLQKGNLPLILSSGAIILIVLSTMAFFKKISYEQYYDILPPTLFILFVAGIIYFIVKPSKGGSSTQQIRQEQQRSRQYPLAEQQGGPLQQKMHEPRRQFEQPEEIESEDEEMIPVSKKEALELLGKKLERKRKEQEKN